MQTDHILSNLCSLRHQKVSGDGDLGCCTPVSGREYPTSGSLKQSTEYSIIKDNIRICTLVMLFS